MPALGHDWVGIGALAEDAGEGDAFERFVIIVLVVRFIVTYVLLPATCASLLALGTDFPVLVELPALLIVLSRVQELAAVAEAAESGLLVVLADVGSEVGDGDGANVGGGFEGADLAGGRIGIFGDEGGVVRGAFVGTVVGNGFWGSGLGREGTGCAEESFEICRVGGFGI